MTGPEPAPLREPRAGTTIEVLRDVLAVPDAYCLYDRDGTRVNTTVTWTAGRRRGPAPPRIDVPRDPTNVDEPVVLGGLFPKAHFGHVLLELFSRLWVHDAGVVDADTPIVHFTHAQRALQPFEERLLASALPTPAPRRLLIDRPMRLRQVLVPSQAIILGQRMESAVLPLYDRIRTELAGRGTTDQRPVYLSRSHLARDRRSTLGEARFEERLARRGVRVVHPQELPLEEQIRTVAHAATVIGLAGSALHLTVLRDLDGARTISLDPRTPFAIQRDVDELRGSRFVHVHAQYPLHPRLPDGRVLEVGRYRNLLLPAPLARRVGALL